MSNNSLFPTPIGPEHRLLELAERLVARNDWQLMPAVDIVRQAAAEPDVVERDDRAIETVMTRIYSQALYIACTSVEESDRRRRGFFELSRYLHCVGQEWCSASIDDLGDLVQTALLKVWENRSKVRSQPSFLIWAYWHMRSAITEWRRRTRNDASLDQLFDNSDTSLIDLLADPDNDPLRQLLLRDGYNELWRIIDQLVWRHRRAADQFKAVLWRYRDGLEDQEIAARLGVSIPQVYVLRSRGLKKLREHFQQLQNLQD